MNRVKILTDSCADLTPELMQRYDIDYARMNTVFEGETSPALLSWTPEDVHAFYGLMRQGVSPPRRCRWMNSSGSLRNIWRRDAILCTSPAPPSSPVR